MSKNRATQTAADRSTRLADILHGGFVGVIELTAESGRVVDWDVEETFKSGRVADRHLEPRDPDRFADELETLLADHFTGRIRAHCNDGTVVRWVRRGATHTNGTALAE